MIIRWCGLFIDSAGHSVPSHLLGPATVKVGLLTPLQFHHGRLPKTPVADCSHAADVSAFRLQDERQRKLRSELDDILVPRHRVGLPIQTQDTNHNIAPSTAPAIVSLGLNCRRVPSIGTQRSSHRGAGVQLRQNLSTLSPRLRAAMITAPTRHRQGGTHRTPALPHSLPRLGDRTALSPSHLSYSPLDHDSSNLADSVGKINSKTLQPKVESLVVSHALASATLASDSWP